MLRYGPAAEVSLKMKREADLAEWEKELSHQISFQKGELQNRGSRDLMLENSDSEESRLYYQKFKQCLEEFVSTIPSKLDAPYNWEILKSNIALEKENCDEFNQRVLAEIVGSS